MANNRYDDRLSGYPTAVESSGRGIRCPECESGRTVVFDSRPRFNGIGRRRRCSNCGARFSTSETVGVLLEPGVHGNIQHVEAVASHIPGWDAIDGDDRATIRRMVAALAARDSNADPEAA